MLVVCITTVALEGMMIADLSFIYLLFDLSDMFDASLCIAVMHHLASTGT